MLSFISHYSFVNNLFLSSLGCSLEKYCFLDRTLAADAQRQSGLAQRRLPLPFMRATTFQFRTAFSAELLPPLRQTASCVLASFLTIA